LLAAVVRHEFSEGELLLYGVLRSSAHNKRAAGPGQSHFALRY
jgi:hypothetical protein